MTPNLVKFIPRIKNDAGPVLCLNASIGIDHSVFLSSSGHVWTCGLNTHCVLGIKPPPLQVLEPYQLKHLQALITGVCASRYHTVAWGPDGVFTWGLNGGQLGHHNIEEKYIIVPKSVSCWLTEFKIHSVAVNNCATAVLNTSGNICVFHDYNMLKISAKQLSLSSLNVIGGRLNNKLDNSIAEENSELRIIGLNKYGNLFIWQESNPHFLRCIFSINRSLNVFHVTSNVNEILFVTREGEAYSGVIKYAKKKVQEERHKRQSHEFLENDNFNLIRVTKIPNVHRAVSIASDFEGKNYVVLQIIPNVSLEVPEVSGASMTEDMFNLLYMQEHESLQNVTFNVGDRVFRAHQYILASGSPNFYKIIKKNPNHIIEFPNTNPDIFEKIMLYLYTKGYNSSKMDKLLENAKILNGAAHNEKMVEEQFKGLKIPNSKTESPKFFHSAFPELHDVILRSKDDKLIPVHKCILMARSEYFSHCFSMRWSEESTLNQELCIPYPYGTLIHLIEYLYTDELPLLPAADVDQVCNLLILADHMCISRLKEICESTLCTFVTLKNIGQVLAFSSDYNSEKLKHYCMEFISLNMAAVLETRALEYVNDDILLELTDFYCDFNSVMQNRIITSYSIAPSDEVVILASQLHPIIFDCDNDKDKIKTHLKSQKRRTRHRKSSSSEPNQIKKNLSSEFYIESEIESPNTTTSQGDYDRIPTRVKAIISAQESISHDNLTAVYTKLNKSTQVEVSFEDFPTLNSNITRQFKSFKITEKHDVKQKFTKVSQKERKRLSSLVENDSEEVPVSESPKNPWKVVPEVISSPDKMLGMQSIIVEEKKQKENFVKMKFKHLAHTQIEDKAIEDLYKFYNVDNVFEEIITIGRVQMGAIAAPVWIHTNKK